MTIGTRTTSPPMKALRSRVVRAISGPLSQGDADRGGSALLLHGKGAAELLTLFGQRLDVHDPGARARDPRSGNFGDHRTLIDLHVVFGDAHRGRRRFAVSGDLDGDRVELRVALA